MPNQTSYPVAGAGNEQAALVSRFVSIIAVAGNIVEELKGRLAASQERVTSLQHERDVLRQQLKEVAVYLQASRPSKPLAFDAEMAAMDDAFSARIRAIDRSFEIARH